MTLKLFDANGHLGKFHGEREVMIFKSLLAAEGRVCKSCYKPGFLRCHHLPKSKFHVRVRNFWDISIQRSIQYSLYFRFDI